MSDQLEAKRLASRKWKEKNKERCAEQRKQWRLANPEKHREINARSTKNNPASHTARVMKRNAAKLLAIPKWVDIHAIDQIYEQAQALGLEVDHIVPLQSNLVCGLHWHVNMQLLSKSDNSAKGNRQWPDMPI